MGPRPRPSRICVTKGGFFGLTQWLRGKSPPLLLLEWCCHAGSRVHPIGDTLCSREGARALFAVKSSNCRIFGIYPEMRAFLIAICIVSPTPWIHACMVPDCIHGSRVHPICVLDHASSRDSGLNLSIYSNCMIYSKIQGFCP